MTTSTLQKRRTISRNIFVLFRFSKATDNKIRYSTDIGGRIHHLYIMKWRLPAPWPNQIKVSIEPLANMVAFGVHDLVQSGLDNLNAEQPIQAIVRYKDEKTETIQYQPIGSRELWELGEPYIPKVLLPDEIPNYLFIRVEWN